LKGLFLMLIALAFGIGSFSDSIGRLDRAGPGLFPLLVSSILFLVGVAMVVRSRGLKPIAMQFNLKNIAIIIAALRPVILTALAAMLAFIPLTHSVFWGTLAYTLIGGTFGGTILTLVFLPALYAIWAKINRWRRTGKPILRFERSLSRFSRRNRLPGRVRRSPASARCSRSSASAGSRLANASDEMCTE
jgi:hypothetical protein